MTKPESQTTESSEPVYNFFSNHSVIIDQPLETVFDAVARGENMEKLIRLGGLTTDFKFKERDTVALPAATPLSATRQRTAPAASEGTNIDSTHRTLPRQHFYLQEKVNVFFGMMSQLVHLYGTHTWDEDAKVALYETQTHSAMGDLEVWKLRVLDEVEEGGKKKTRVTETVKGRCPALLKRVVQKEINTAHPYVLFFSTPVRS